MPSVIIVGAGPAGATLAYLLAHRGIDVTLLERQQNSSREFRGEVLMPSGVEAIEEMGLTDAMASVPQQIQESITLYLNGSLVFSQEFDAELFQGHPPQAISQPHFLEMLIGEAEKSPRFKLERGASVKELLFEGTRVVGVRARTHEGERHYHADLVVGADGRASAVRKHGGFESRHVSPPLDVVWWKIPCPTDWVGPSIFMGKGHFMLAYENADEQLQIAWLILKGSYRKLKDRNSSDWLKEIADHISPSLGSFLRENEDELEKPFLLDSVSDCVKQWSIPGALLIGDAAHTMSPVGGQGINIALRDTIVATNHLVPALLSEDPAVLDQALKAIEKERMPEVRHIQRLQGMPPKVGFSSAWWSEPLRRLVAKILARPGARSKLAGRVKAMPFGVTKVRLRH